MRTLTESSIIFTSFWVNQLFYRKKLPPPSDIKKILVVKLDHIGDVLLATPAITNLRLHYPHAHITLLIGSWSKQVIESNPHIDEILCYDSPFFRRSSRGTTLKDAMQMLRWLKSERYGLIVELRGDFLTLALAMLEGGKYRLDRSTQRVLKKLSDFLKKDKSAYPEHEVEINLDVLRAGEIPITSRKTFFNVPPREQTWAKSFLSALGMDISKPIVAIHPGSPVPLKRWPAERFAELADILIEKKMQVLFLGGADEEQLVEEIQSQMRHNSVNIAGQINLQQLGAVLQNCHLFIGNDSGPMHIAAAVGTCVIGLFGPSSPQRFGPFGDNCIAIRKKSDCPPCMKEKCSLRSPTTSSYGSLRSPTASPFGSLRSPTTSSYGRHKEGCTVEILVEDVLDILNTWGFTSTK